MLCILQHFGLWRFAAVEDAFRPCAISCHLNILGNADSGRRRSRFRTDGDHDSEPMAIGDPTIADSILDRLVHTAHRLELKGDSIRKGQLRGGKDEAEG